MYITQAIESDLNALKTLINNAYRAASGVKGWTYEGHLLKGNRTDLEYLNELLQADNSVIMKCMDEDENIIGSVHLEKHGDSLHLGMLAVDPTKQDQGIGKYILTQSKVYAQSLGCTSILITVISIRHELIAWYERFGFIKTGEFIPFHAGERFGKQQQPLELIGMKISLEPSFSN